MVFCHHCRKAHDASPEKGLLVHFPSDKDYYLHLWANHPDKYRVRCTVEGCHKTVSNADRHRGPAWNGLNWFTQGADGLRVEGGPVTKPSQTSDREASTDPSGLNTLGAAGSTTQKQRAQSPHASPMEHQVRGSTPPFSEEHAARLAAFFERDEPHHAARVPVHLPSPNHPHPITLSPSHHLAPAGSRSSFNQEQANQLDEFFGRDPSFRDARQKFEGMDRQGDHRHSTGTATPTTYSAEHAARLAKFFGRDMKLGRGKQMSYKEHRKLAGQSSETLLASLVGRR
ncbi:hypothetical protein T439DRAFT_360298 [Meredithblackwellia eburnea MCA 4105]